MLQLHQALASCTLQLAGKPAATGLCEPLPRRICGPGLPTKEGAGDHVGISPERDTLPWGLVGRPWAGNEASWRDPPRSGVTVQAAILIVLACLCSGMLFGTAWTIQALQPKLRRQAEERRSINAEWQALRNTQQSVQLVRCLRCGCRLSEGSWYFEEDEPDGD
jgi:hypothetical protein